MMKKILSLLGTEGSILSHLMKRKVKISPINDERLKDLSDLLEHHINRMKVAENILEEVTGISDPDLYEICIDTIRLERSCIGHTVKKLKEERAKLIYDNTEIRKII